MSDWILENEDLENERLFNVHTNIEYIKISTGEWELGNPKEGFSISKYSDIVYQQLKSVLLCTGHGDPIEKTLRDEFAMAAFKGLLSNSYPHSSPVLQSSYDFLAKEAYKYADAMLEERNKRTLTKAAVAASLTA